jgi:hypothetical protein
MFLRKSMIIVMFSLLLFLLGSCLSDMIALEEVGPKAADTKKPTTGLKPVTAPVLEIVEEGGVQKLIYLRIGTKNSGIRYGLKGLIYNDPTMIAPIGKFQLTEVYADMSTGKVLELNYKIAPNAVVKIEVDPDHLVE